MLEAYEEHHVVDKAMAEREQTSVEVEEGEMFPQARQMFDAEGLQALGEQMAARKEHALQDPTLLTQER